MTDKNTETLVARLKLRGVKISPDPAFAKMVPWTRLTFALCTGATAVATVFACTTMLWSMVPIAIVGAATRRHPFDHIYNHIVRRFTGTSELPPNAAPTRFACGTATIWFIIMALAFQLGYAPLGYTLGAMFVAIGTLVSITHFCIPSVIYQFLFGDRSLIKPAIYSGAAA
jgi:hypothetical protein